MEPQKQRVLVTGASGGIGLAIAEECARLGCSLLLVARSADKLAAESQRLSRTHGVDVDFFVADLTDPDAPDRLFESASAGDTPVTVLVNNAGFATYGLFHELPRANELSMVRVNIEALVDLTHRFLPALISRGDGGILNVASIAGFQPGPLMATYYASKAFVLSFSQALANEVAEYGVTVTALCPGPTRSAFQERAGMQQSRLLRLGTMSAADVARAGVRGFFRGKQVVIPGLFGKTSAFATRFLPRRFVTALVRRLQSPE